MYSRLQIYPFFTHCASKFKKNLTFFAKLGHFCRHEGCICVNKNKAPPSVRDAVLVCGIVEKCVCLFHQYDQIFAGAPELLRVGDAQHILSGGIGIERVGTHWMTGF